MGRSLHIFLDVDGVIVDDFEFTDEELWETLAECRARGVGLSLITARPKVLCDSFLGRIGNNGPHIFNSGAVVSSDKFGDTFPHGFIPASLISKLVQVAAVHHLRIAVTSSGGFYLCERSREQLKRRFPKLKCEDLRAAEDGVLSVLVKSNRGAPFPKEALSLVAKYQGAVTMRSSRLTELEVLPSGALKETTLQLVAGKFSIPLQNSMMVADSLEDLSSLKLVGVRCIPANASVELLQSDFFTSSLKTSQATASFIHEYVLGS